MKPVLFLFLIFFFSEPTWANIEPSEWLTKKIAELHGEKNRVVLKTRVIEVRSEEETSNQFVSETRVDFTSGVIQSTAFETDGKEVLYRVERRLDDTQIGRVPANNFLMFSPKNRHLPLARALIHLRVPIRLESDLMEFPSEEERQKHEKTGVERWDGGVVRVIGNPKKLEEAQLWLHKTQFYPIRLLFQKNFEIRYQAYRFYDHGYPFPDQTQFFVDGDLRILEKKMEGPKSTQPFRQISSGYTQAGKDVGTDLKNLIDLYYKVLR